MVIVIVTKIVKSPRVYSDIVLSHIAQLISPQWVVVKYTNEFESENMQMQCPSENIHR